MLFHERLKEIRLATAFTQKQMADLLGISLRSYQRYEQGTVEPNIPSIIRIAERFNISLDYLFGLTEDPRKIR